MNIKDIILKIKNRSIADVYEKNFNVADDINSLYVDKFLENYSYEKDVMEIKNKNNNITKKNKFSNSKISFKKHTLIFFMSTLFVSSISTFFSSKNISLVSFFQDFLFFSLVTSLIYIPLRLVYSFCRLLKTERNKSIIIEKSKIFMDLHYKKFFSDITLDLINEIDSINDSELQKAKDELKEYLISKSYELNNDENASNDNRHLIIKYQMIHRMFIYESKPINNKILKKTQYESNVEMINNDYMLKDLKVKYNEKTPII